MRLARRYQGGTRFVEDDLPDLGFVEGCCDARQSCLNLLPYVGPGWYPKVSLAAMLDLGVCRWDHIVLGISARSHVGAATLRRALERMDAAWQGEERMAKLSVNAMIGLWARSTEVVYSVRSSSSELDGAGADFSQAFAYKGGMVWDFVYARRLLSNGTYFPSSLSSFSPTTSRVCRIPLTSGTSFIDPKGTRPQPRPTPPALSSASRSLPTASAATTSTTTAAPWPCMTC